MTTSRLRHLAAALVAGAGVAPAVLPAWGQQRSSIIVLVRNSTTSEPLAQAQVILTRSSGGDTTATTDSTGRHVFGRLPAGSYVIRATWKELVSPPATLQLADRERLEVEFAVGPRPEATQLPELAVEAERGPRPLMRGFDERREKADGQFLTREDLAHRTGVTLGELLRSLRGIRVSCRGGTCVPYMQRAPQGCAPVFLLDDIEVEPMIAVRTISQDIEGVEVYQGLSQLPLELAGDRHQVRCGMIVVWTRRPGLPRP
jgi:hypothetical protein